MMDIKEQKKQKERKMVPGEFFFSGNTHVLLVGIECVDQGPSPQTLSPYNLQCSKFLSAFL